VNGTSGTGWFCRSKAALLESFARVSSKIQAVLTEFTWPVTVGAGDVDHRFNRFYFDPYC
jgi:hypothetical protein